MSFFYVVVYLFAVLTAVQYLLILYGCCIAWLMKSINSLLKHFKLILQNRFTCNCNVQYCVWWLAFSISCKSCFVYFTVMFVNVNFCNTSTMFVYQYSHFMKTICLLVVAISKKQKRKPIIVIIKYLIISRNFYDIYVIF